MDINPQLELAFNFVEFTGTSVFLTGKAGTGKTTFLRELRARSPKRMVVLAPTGIAAINAGGVTIHSFFQLPFGPYLPGNHAGNSTGEKRFTNKFNREKIDIIRSMDLLVIDEISMVRADLLDAIHDVLCRYRDRDKPFGGVQLLLIGDLQQLAPVVREEEWELLKGVYSSPFFFNSLALQQLPYFCVELTRVYRQADVFFLRLLNQIRENRADADTLRLLNQRYIPGFNPDDSEGYIVLTTHNHQAQQLNQKRLKQIEEREYTYKAEVKDDFPEYAFPTDASLVLKKGAQVMFVKNDSSSEKRYYNGKIGRITALSPEHILVRCADGKEAISVEREEWNNTRYSINPETGEIIETVTGSFKQYPLKTAWAITIHKSQGLTFEKAVVDAAFAFTHGQVYVALSRCKTLEGLVLGSPLRLEALVNDPTVKEYTEYVQRNVPETRQLQEAQQEYYLLLLKELFDYSLIVRKLQYATRLVCEHLWKLYPELAERYKMHRERCYKELLEVGERFQMQLEEGVRKNKKYEEDEWIRERVIKGVEYFREKTRILLVELLESTHPETDNKETRKTLEEALMRLQQEIEVKMTVLEGCREGFGVKAYLSLRARALLEKPKRRTKKESNKVEAGGDILHPRLYEILRMWRKEEALRLKLPAYTVLQQKALLGVANTMPTRSKELLAIPGIGKKVVERYGIRLLEIVDEYRLKINGD
ncbi:HRDC domain-containing protein [Odoribacter sp. Z80]|uniref:HRDC domain-containing protein n=1 Tax=Odoribacter sp. Z80 TaxID=2304575 RepID=UPI00137B2940|nr:HRDC domain-containing protein [Odoribacter sp. Z80]NCE72918.1 helicase [Odoribacter sp. Z80]